MDIRYYHNILTRFRNSKVQIRLPQGKRIVRRFRETDTVKVGNWTTCLPPLHFFYSSLQTLRLFIQSEITEAFNIILPPATRLEDEVGNVKN